MLLASGRGVFVRRLEPRHLSAMSFAGPCRILGFVFGVAQAVGWFELVADRRRRCGPGGVSDASQK